MTRTAPPVCRSTATWLRTRLGKDCLAPLTGQDHRALKAFVHLLELYAVSDEAGRVLAIAAMHATVRAMQPSTRRLCKAAIPAVLDWDDEELLWRLLGIDLVPGEEPIIHG